MKYVLIGLAALVVVIMAVAVALPLLVSEETVRKHLITRVQDATGRALTIDGDVKVSLLPRVKLELNGVTFANAAGAAMPDMLKLSRLQLDVGIFPLIRGNLDVSRFVLVDPVIDIEIGEDGRGNWVFDEGESSTVGGGADSTPRTAGSEPDDDAEARGGFLRNVRLGDIRIENGTVRYRDARSGRKETLTGISLDITMADFDSPFAAKGELTWNGEPINVDLGLASPRAVIDAESTQASAGITSKHITLVLDGGLSFGSPFGVNGAVDLDVPSMRNLAAWAGSPLTSEDDGTLGPLKISGKLDLSGSAIAFEEAQIAVDEIRAKGRIRIETSGTVPALDGALEIERLDLNPYLGNEDASAAVSAPAQSSQQAAAAPGEDEGWSDEPIDLTGLRDANANFDLAVGSIRFREIEFGRSRLKLALDNGLLDLRLTELALYAGAGAGRIVVDAVPDVPRIEVNFDLTGLQAEPFLKDAAGFDRLSGTGAIKISVSTSGRSQAEFVSALNGSGKIAFRDGTISGINLAAMARNVAAAFLDSSAGEARKTDFTELSGSFTITSGLLRNHDLLLLSPLLRLAGEGAANLPPRTMDYRLTPRIAATAEGQGGQREVAGISVPIIIEGPWSDLSYKPDLAALITEELTNPGNAEGVVKGILKSLRPGGGGGEDGEASERTSPVDTIRGLFRRRN